MDILNWIDINNTFVTIPLGSGYALSWIEAIATVFGLLCIWCASQAKLINFFFGIVNVILFACIFYQIQLYGLLMLQVFFLVANIYGWYAWSHKNQESGTTLTIRWLTTKEQLLIASVWVASVLLLTRFIDPVFQFFTDAVIATINLFGGNLAPIKNAPDAFPFWDSVITVTSVVAQILMTRKYVENWHLWIIVNIASVGVYAAQGVYFLALEYAILLFIAGNGARLWMKQAKHGSPSDHNPMP